MFKFASATASIPPAIGRAHARLAEGEGAPPGLGVVRRSGVEAPQGLAALPRRAGCARGAGVARRQALADDRRASAMGLVDADGRRPAAVVAGPARELRSAHRRG